jgi:TolA-binding protein
MSPMLGNRFDRGTKSLPRRREDWPRFAGLWLTDPAALVVLAWTLATGSAFAAATTERRAFDAAAKSFGAGFFQRAEEEFGYFAQTFTNSPRLAQALLLQAEARMELTNYAGAVSILASNLANAGPLADQYQFWLAEAAFRRGEFQQAAGQFGDFLTQFPASSRCLEAAVRRAEALARLGEWGQVSGVLGDAGGVFQRSAQSNVAADIISRGWLLLSEAYLALGRFTDATAALHPLASRPLTPRARWEKQHLECRILAAEGRPEEALQGAGDLLSLSTNVPEPAIQADSILFKAGLLERLGRFDEAIAAYSLGFARRFPGDRQRHSLLKATEICLARNKSAEAAELLRNYLAQYPDAPAADLAWLTLGELCLRELQAGPGNVGSGLWATNPTGQTNCLEQALSAFGTLLKKFPNSPLAGKAQLDLAWCFWLAGKIPDCETASQTAVLALPPSTDQARAFFKLADAQFQQGKYAAATSNYLAVTESFKALPEVRTNLLEPALYQVARAGLASSNWVAATNALAQMLACCSTGPFADKTVMIIGQELSRLGDAAGARGLFMNFATNVPSATLLPEIRLAVAGTYEQEQQWDQAILDYAQWLDAYTNHPACPRAEFSLAWAELQSGAETNALSRLTNFLARYPTNEFTPLAQWQLADYYFCRGNFVDAERNYQLLFLNTNLPPSELTYQARMMAGRAAVARQGWEDARAYFTNLWEQTYCPMDLRIQALFAYGDYWMSRDSTNKLADYGEAISVFSKIVESYPSNRLAVLALGEKANAVLQWAQFSQDYEPATNAFRQVLDFPGADVTARSIAKVGLALVIEKQAQSRAGADRDALLAAALNFYLDVLYGKDLREGETQDVFWTRKAGLEAGRLAETLRLWPQALQVYGQLQALLPSLRTKLENKIQSIRAQQQLAAGGS